MGRLSGYSIVCPECGSESVETSAVEAQCQACGCVWDLPDDYTADYVREASDAEE